MIATIVRSAERYPRTWFVIRQTPHGSGGEVCNGETPAEGWRTAIECAAAYRPKEIRFDIGPKEGKA